jgi:hypothetical protein
VGLDQEAWKQAWWYRAVHQRIGICRRCHRLAETNRSDSFHGLGQIPMVPARTRLWESQSSYELPDPAQLRDVSTTLA